MTNRAIASHLKLSKNTVMGIVKRSKQEILISRKASQSNQAWDSRDSEKAYLSQNSSQIEGSQNRRGC
jgi:transposase